MPEVADIFRLYGAGYLDRFGAHMLPSHRRALRDLSICRTAALGGQLYVCDHCAREQYVYHSCRNRACPKCHGTDTEAWLAHRRDELLPVPYFHVIFTIPKQLRPLIRQHQATLYPILIRAAAKALTKLAADPHYVGGLIGVMAILHTWTRTLVYHPHVHCLLPGGGLGRDGQWRHARKNFLVPVKALSKIFRGIFLDLASKALPDTPIPRSTPRRWVAHCKPTLHGTDNVLAYLGRYVHRVAITNGRILAVQDGKVTFRYRNVGETAWRPMTLGAHEFIRRFLQHVPPKGLHKVRYYGLWAPSYRRRLRELQTTLACELDTSFVPSAQSLTQQTPSPSRIDGSPCPFCSSGTLIFLRRLPRHARAPP